MRVRTTSAMSPPSASMAAAISLLGAAKIAPGARRIKIADQTSNLFDIVRAPEAWPALQAAEYIEGAERVSEVVVVDQTPAVRSPRSNPATVSKAFRERRFDTPMGPIAIDPHKWLFSTAGSCAVLYREPQLAALAEAARLGALEVATCT